MLLQLTMHHRQMQVLSFRSTKVFKNLLQRHMCPSLFTKLKLWLFLKFQTLSRTVTILSSVLFSWNLCTRYLSTFSHCFIHYSPKPFILSSFLLVFLVVVIISIFRDLPLWNTIPPTHQVSPSVSFTLSLPHFSTFNSEELFGWLSCSLDRLFLLPEVDCTA